MIKLLNKDYKSNVSSAYDISWMGMIGSCSTYLKICELNNIYSDKFYISNFTFYNWTTKIVAILPKRYIVTSGMRDIRGYKDEEWWYKYEKKIFKLIELGGWFHSTEGLIEN